MNKERRHIRVRLPAVLAFGIMLLASCAQTKSVRIYEDLRTGVVIRKAASGDPYSPIGGYSHPYEIESEELKFLLGGIRYTEKGFFGWSESERVFSAEELYRLTPHLVEAFAKAQPDNEVLFRLTSAKRGAVLASERFTSGTMFVEEGALHCVFANVNVKPHVEDVFDGNPRKYFSGSLWRLEQSEWQKLFEDEKGSHYNWIVLDIAAGRAEKKRVEDALKESVRRRVLKRKQPAEGSDWRDWQPDEEVAP